MGYDYGLFSREVTGSNPVRATFLDGSEAEVRAPLKKCSYFLCLVNKGERGRVPDVPKRP